MSSKLTIISNAYILLGERKLVSLLPTDNNSTLLDTQDIYDLVLNEMFTYFWRFNLQVETLAPLLAPPPLAEFTKAFQIPGQCLKIYRAIPNVYYQKFQTEIWSNAEEMQIVCSIQVPEADFPTFFESALTYMLAFRIAPRITNNEEVIARMDKLATETLAVARFQDNSQNPNPPIQSDPYNFGHLNGTFFGNRGGCGGFFC